MDKDCPICSGIGWVCENHPDKAWHDEVGCTCGAGMPCQCNQEGDDGELLDTTEIIFERVTVH
jgi:hypothetical protein